MRNKRASCDFTHVSIINYVSHYSDVIMGVIASQIASLAIVYSTIYSGTDQRKYQSSASLAFVLPVKSPHKGPVTRKIFSFDDVIMGQMLSGKIVLKHEEKLISHLIYSNIIHLIIHHSKDDEWSVDAYLPIWSHIQPEHLWVNLYLYSFHSVIFFSSH